MRMRHRKCRKSGLERLVKESTICMAFRGVWVNPFGCGWLSGIGLRVVRSE